MVVEADFWGSGALMFGSGAKGGRAGVEEAEIALVCCEEIAAVFDDAALDFAAGREGLRSCWLFLRDLVPGPTEGFLAAAMEALKDRLGDGSLEAKGELAAEEVAEDWAVGLEEDELLEASRATEAVGLEELLVFEPCRPASASPPPTPETLANLSIMDVWLVGCEE